MPTPGTSPTSRRPLRREPQAHGWRIAEAIAAAWNTQHGTGNDLHIPLGVVAALALCRPVDHDLPRPAAQLAALDDAGAVEMLRVIWSQFLQCRPDLAVRVMPLVAWITEAPSDWQLDGVRAAAAAADRTGLHDLTRDADRLHDIDLLGMLLTELRSSRAKAARGQYYSPPEAGDIMARIILHAGPTPPADIPRGASFCDPTAGTGVMLGAVARVLRYAGRDPAEFRWYANDVDVLAAACLAVNAHLWDLGPRVVIGCADTLANDWVPGAYRDRKAGIDALRHARALALLRLIH